jgi:hypothetical protein
MSSSPIRFVKKKGNGLTRPVLACAGPCYAESWIPQADQEGERFSALSGGGAAGSNPAGNPPIFCAASP